MTVRSGFFNSIGGDRKYDAARFAEYFGSFIGNGIFPQPANGLKVTANSNMTVTVQPGKAWINGYFLVNDDNYILTIENADGALNRIDRIVARYDVIDREIRLQVKKGTFSSSPVAPSMQRDSDAYELALADIYIAFGTTSIVQANITDLRKDVNYCGVVDSLIAGNVNLLSARIDDLYEIVPTKLDKTGDGKDITATFTEAATDADIASGEKLSIMFGKILKKFKNIVSGATAVGKAATLDGLLSTITELNFVKGVASAIQTQLNGKAPTSHASTGSGYGIGDASNYGHVKVRNDLLGTETSGATVSPAQIKVLNDSINNKGIMATGQVTYTDTISANATLTKTIPIGSNKKQGRALITNSLVNAVGSMMFFNIDKLESMIFSYNAFWHSRYYEVIGNANEITNNNLVGFTEFYISGTNLIVTFKNKNNSAVTLNCTIAWEVWSL